MPGLLNGNKFDKENIMLKSLPQNVTGKKVFQHANNGELYFNSIDFKAPVNNIYLPQLFRNQVRLN